MQGHDEYLLGPRASDKIRDRLLKMRPGPAIKAIQDERSSLNHSNSTGTLCSYSIVVFPSPPDMFLRT